METSAVQNYAAPNSVEAPSPQLRAKDRELIQAVKALNRSEMFGGDSELTFILDRETRRPVVRIVDRETREVIRQIPPEYALRLADDLKAVGQQGR